jgi:predicted transcriptional regulator of viral defense system
MNLKNALHVLNFWDTQGKYIFTKRMLEKLFSEDNQKTLSESLGRLVKNNILTRACRGIYVNPDAKSFDSQVIEKIAITLRRGEYNYISLESMLSEYGLISQIPVDRLTVMTTGREGQYETPYGIIEFTHTKRSVLNILTHTLKASRPLRIATAEAALRDFKRVGRNTNLLLSRIEND